MTTHKYVANWPLHTPDDIDRRVGAYLDKLYVEYPDSWVWAFDGDMGHIAFADEADYLTFKLMFGDMK